MLLRAASLLCTFVAACLVGGASSIAPDQAATNAAPDDAVKVVTFNIRYGTAGDGPNAWPHRREMVADLLREMNADIVGLQEALRFQLDYLAAAVPGYVEIGVGRDDGVAAGEYAALFVRADRFAIAASGTFWLSDTPDTPGSRTWGNGIPRICTWMRLIETPARSSDEGDAQGTASGRRTATESPRGVWVYNVHLDHMSAPSRERAAEQIAAHIHDRPPAFASEPVILMGDFNAGEESSPLKYLRGETDRASVADAWPGHTPVGSPELVDTFRTIDSEEQEVGTFSGFRMGETTGAKIDHILTSERVKVLDAGIDRTSRDGRYPSDHFPVWAVLDF